MRLSRAALGFFSIALIGAYVRLNGFRCLAVDGRIHFFDPDALYHMRQIHWGAVRFPFLPIHDSYLPGGVSPWPGGFDWIFSALLRVAYFFGLRGAFAEEIFVSVAVSLTGLLVVAAVFFYSRALFGQTAAWIAAILAAIVPACVDGSRFGRVDHHLFEPLVLTLALNPKISLRLRGIILGAAVVLSQSNAVPIAIAAACLFLSDVSRKRQLKRPVCAAIALPALITATPLILLTSWAHARWFDYRFVSLFHLGLMTAWTVLAFAISTSQSRRRWGLIGIASFLLILLAVPLLQSARFLAQNEIVNMASEAASAMNSHIFELGYLSSNVYIWPIALVFMAATIWKRRESFGVLELLFASAASGILMLIQLRFALLAATLMCVGVGDTLARASYALQQWIEKRFRNQRLAVATSFLLVLTWIVVSHRAFARDLVQLRCGRSSAQIATFRLMDWLRENTPDPGVGGDPTVAPTYRILAPWPLGHHLSYFAQRPAILANFIFDADTPGLEDAVRFYYQDSLEEAATRANRLHIRYVVVPNLAPFAPKEVQPFNRTVAQKLRAELRTGESRKAGSLFRRTTAGILYYENLPSQSRFRLVHEERSENADDLPIFRVYELKN